MKKILCTGGCGALGAPLVHALVAEGHDVTVLDNEARGRWDRLKELNIVRWGMDVRDILSVKKVDCVIHLAAINGTKNFYERPADVLDVGIEGTRNVLDVCIAEDVPEFLFVSSSEVYGDPTMFPTPETHSLTIPDPLNPRFSYAASKIAGEMLTLHSRIPRVLVVRPFNIYGPDMAEDHVIPQFIRRICAMRPPSGLHVPFKIQGTGKETRSFCYIDDFVSGMITVLDKGEHRGIYNIGTEDEVCIEQLAYRIAAELDSHIWTVPSEVAQGSPGRRCPSNSRLKNLGWQQERLLQNGLRETVKWYREHSAKEKQSESV